MVNNKINRILIGIVIIFVFTLCSCNGKPDIQIFSNIQQCKSAEILKSDNAKITIYDFPTSDKHLKEIKYQDFFACNYVCESFSFELCAYEFFSAETAMQYFENATSKKNDPNPTFLDSTGMNNFTRIVVKGNKAYNVSCKKDDEEKVIEFLNNWFDEKVF